jgi:hypothetical protein
MGIDAGPAPGTISPYRQTQITLNNKDTPIKRLLFVASLPVPLAAMIVGGMLLGGGHGIFAACMIYPVGLALSAMLVIMADHEAGTRRDLLYVCWWMIYLPCFGLYWLWYGCRKLMAWIKYGGENENA